jgi:hypothetical protein
MNYTKLKSGSSEYNLMSLFIDTADKISKLIENSKIVMESTCQDERMDGKQDKFL